jgi:hypothetical protein
MDGCFDMMHYGHSNALRQVGINFVGVLLYSNLNAKRAGKGCGRRSRCGLGERSRNRTLSLI